MYTVEKKDVKENQEITPEARIQEQGKAAPVVSEANEEATAAENSVSQDDALVASEASNKMTQEERAKIFDQIKKYKDVLFNDLVGDYDDDGEYVVSQEIMQDLIDMPKKIDFIDSDGIHARGFLGDHTFSFLITPPIERKNGEAFCYLKLNEQVDRMAGFQFETVTSTIATYEYTFDEFYDQRVREVFCLAEYEGDDTGEEGRKYRADYITSRYDLFYAMRACSEDYYERLEEIYFNHRIQMLGMEPELTAILAEFNKKRNKLDPYLIVSRRRFYFLNQLLDEILQLNASRLTKSEMNAQMSALDDKFIQKSIEIKEKTLTHPKVLPLLPQTTNVQTAEVKGAAKKPTPAKKGVKKGGDKPKAKKKGGKKGGGGGKGKPGGNKKPKPQMSVYSKTPQPINVAPMIDTIPKQKKDELSADLFWGKNQI